MIVGAAGGAVGGMDEPAVGIAERGEAEAFGKFAAGGGRVVVVADIGCAAGFRAAVFLVFLDNQAEVVVFADDVVDDVAAADGGVVVGGELLDQATHFVRRADAADGAIDSAAESCDAVVDWATERVIFVVWTVPFWSLVSLI